MSSQPAKCQERGHLRSAFIVKRKQLAQAGNREFEDGQLGVERVDARLRS